MRPNRELFRQADQTYFVTFQTAQRQCFFRNDRWAIALLNIIQRYQESYALHDFVIMADHVHLLMSPQVPIERAVQLIKGGFSFHAKRAFEWKGDIWQAGFSDHRLRDARDYEQHLVYISENIRRTRQEEYRFCGARAGVPLAERPPRLKPLSLGEGDGGAEAPPLQS